ncbi:GH18 family chitinase [Microbacter margulisiae]|uniref:chitinase n=1 Tax=Microbacter margulisiae TaxID=1350067 RepID=A0A7W5H217_9PORP|nr:GH18 family chitinase [Microbacter margulisiae]
MTFYKAPVNSKFQVVGYIPSYRNIDAIPDSKLRQLDVVIYAFATINSSLLPEIDQPDKLQTLVSRCHALGVKVLLSFNGSQQYFVLMASQKSTRDLFVNALKEDISKYNLDGIDNDWEYPSVSDGSGYYNALLMKQLSDFCHKGNPYLLTMAITSGLYVGAVSNGILPDVFDDVDWFNVMIYDDYSTTQSYVQHSPYSMLLASFNYWITVRNLARTKFVAGIPFYGRPSGISMTGNTLSYADIIDQGGDCMSDSALVITTTHSAPFWIYYNGMTTVQRKIQYSFSQGLGGVMFWEISMDTNDNSSLMEAVENEINRMK